MDGGLITFIIFGIFMVAMGVISILNKRKSEKKYTGSLALFGLTPAGMINAGTYVEGHPELKEQFPGALIGRAGDELVIGYRLKDKFYKLAIIPAVNSFLSVTKTYKSEIRNDTLYAQIIIRWMEGNEIYMMKFAFFGDSCLRKATDCREYLLRLLC